MINKKLRIMNIAILLIMLVTTITAGAMAMQPGLRANADMPEENILSDVDYHRLTLGNDDQFNISYFVGYMGSPTVGSFFAYGNPDLYKGYSLPISWVTFKDPLATTQKINVPSVDKSLNSYVFTLSFDLIGGGYVEDNKQVYDKCYRQLGYFNFKRFLNGTSICSIEILKDTDTGEYYLYSPTNDFLSVLDGISETEGEFISFSFVIPETQVIGDFTTRMPCSRNYYCTANLNHEKVEKRANQSFLDIYSYQAYLGGLYGFDSSFYMYSEDFNDILADAIIDNYNKGYSAGFKEGNLQVDQITSLDWLRSLFSSVTALFNIKLFGSVTLATLIFIPLILSTVLLVLRFIK